jgi:catechol 2,3-dioxygenase-like lactoylglutathione lyase family enzyme
MCCSGQRRSGHGRTGVNVSEIERSLDFYQQLAGFELVSPRETVDQWRWAWIKSGDGELMLSESGRPATREDQIDPSRAEWWPAIYYLTGCKF